MGLNIRGRMLRLFSATVFDQVLLSGTNFAVGLLLVRYTADSDYAIYVLLQTALALIVSAHSAAICSPLSILAPKKSPESKQRMVGAIRRSRKRFLRPLALLALVAVAVARQAHVLELTSAWVLAIGVAAAWATVERDYLRCILLIYARVHTIIAVDAIYAVVLLAGMIWAAFGFGKPTIWIVIAMAAAAWACAAASSRALAGNPGWVDADAKPMWREMRPLGTWALVGAVIYWVFGRSYNYVLASRLDLTAVAGVNAVRLMVVPALLITTGLQSILPPLAASWLAEIGLGRLARRLLGLVLVIAAGDLLYFGLIWILRDWVTGHLLHKHIADRDPLFLLWAGFTLVALVREVIVCAVYALGELKWLARQVALSAAVALCLMWFSMPYWGSPAIIMGLIIGEALNVAGILHLIRKTQRLRSADAGIVRTDDAA